ncbi:hypothetical protein BH20ACI1_BH20ACI1_02790 [soil metagenome]
MSLAKKLFLICWLCFPFLTAQAQYRFDYWTADTGLPQNSVFSIVQTGNGYLWMTTLDGLVRFDGVKFTAFNKSNSKNLNSNRFTNLTAEADGTLWIATENSGLAHYHNKQFQTFTTADGLPSNIVQYTQKDTDGSILIFTPFALLRLKDGNFSLVREQDYRDYRLYISPSGARWEINKSGITLEKNGVKTRFDLPFDRNRIASDRTFNYFFFVPMFEDREGALWFAAENNLYKLKDDSISVLAAADGMPDSRVEVINQDADGNLWLGTTDNGACRLAENRIVCFGTSDGLSSNHIKDILVDREGTLWLTTNDGGINRVTKKAVAPLSTADGLLDKNVYPILEDDQNDFWLGTTSSLSRLQNGRIFNYTRGDGLLYEIVQSLFKDADGRLWIGSIGGVEYLENGKFVDFTETLNLKIGDADFYDIHRDKSGVLWFATSKGLVKYENGQATKYTVAENLPNDEAKLIFETRDGTLWFGTQGGLARLENNRFISYTEKDGLAGNSIRSIYEDADGFLWIGTYDSGLSLFRNGKFTNFRQKDGLSSNGVFAILPDAAGNFWMSSNQGIYRVSRRQLLDFADERTATINSAAFGKSDGMLNQECNGGRQPAGIVANDGKLWFPTQNGAAIIDPHNVPFNPIPPPVMIESVLIDNVQLELPASADGSDITIKSNQNNLEIAYAGLSYIKPEQVHFRYRLEGLDKVWTDAGVRRTAFYPYLPAGKYVFRVIAANSDNVWNEQGAAISIVVLPPFYQTWWFFAVCALAVGAAIFAVYKNRVNRFERARLAQQDFSRRLINAHEAERSRVAAELHDSIGQTLAMIKNRAVFGTQSADDKEAKEQLAQITAQTTQAIGEVREISYNLRPYLLENLGLTKAIKSLVGKIEEVHLIDIDARIDDIDNLFALEAEMSVYRIVQETLNNVVKHSEADKARLTIEKTVDSVTITIADDRCGFDKNAPPKSDAEKGGFGLLGIKERVKMLGGILDITTKIGGGTIVTIKINVEKPDVKG